MREPRLIEVTELAAEEIDVTGRLRPVSEAGVAAIMASIAEMGIVKDEVAVRRVRHQGNRLVLMAGGHRVEACRRLGRKVPAKIWDCADDWARLVEIDDNLARADLCALDQAVFLAARKEIYEQLHPETVHGGDRKSLYYQEKNQTDIMSFCSATAEKFGLSERHVRRMIRSGSRLSPEDVAALRAAPKPVTLADLQQLAKTTSDGEREAVVGAVALGTAKNAAEARRRWLAAQPGSGRTVPKNPDEVAWIALVKAWAGCRKSVRRRFVKANAPALSALLAEYRDQRLINGRLGLEDDDEAGLRVISNMTGGRP